MSEKKAVFRRSNDGRITSFRRESSTTDAEVTDQTDQADPPKEYGQSDRAKERWAKLRAYFQSPLKAKELQTKKVRHTSSLRDRAFDTTPQDYRSQLEKHRSKRGDQ